MCQNRVVFWQESNENASKFVEPQTWAKTRRLTSLPLQLASTERLAGSFTNKLPYQKKYLGLTAFHGMYYNTFIYKILLFMIAISDSIRIYIDPIA